MRKCNKCNQTLTISDNWSLSMEKNHLYTCKPCWSKRAKSYYKKNKPTILEQQKELYHTSYKHDEEKLQKYRDYDKVWASKQRKKSMTLNFSKVIRVVIGYIMSVSLLISL